MTWAVPTNWYWNVQDSSPGTQNWQSSSGAFVGFADADYVAFLAAGNFPTSIDTFVNLMVVIDSYNQGLWAGGQFNGVVNRTFNANVTLTNPMLLTQEFTAGSTHSVILPIMNVPGSIPKGVPFVIYANGPYRTFSVLVRAQDGTLLYTANGGQVLTLLLTDNSTQNGTFVETAVTQPTPLPPQVGGTGQATLTSFGVLIGEGTGSVNSVVLGDAQLLVGQTGADPQAKTLSGDATLADTGALTLVSTITAGGPTGDATHVPQITYDAKGRLTAVTSVAITGTAPGGSAGGDLSGTYPNPTVAKVNGVSYGAPPSTNTVPVVTGANAITYEAVPNAALANSSMTIAGHSVSLGGSTSIASTDLSDTANLVRTVKKQTFTGSGTYTPSSGMLYCILECVGGGGGGGGASGTAAQTFGGSGGGSGSYSRKLATATDIGASKTVTIGAAGTGGSAGSNDGAAGGDTSVGTLCVGKGGSGGKHNDNAAITSGGAGGVAGTGDLTPAGQPGSAGLYSNSTSIYLPSGNGGSSIFGGGALGVAASPTANGNNASNYGSGGSGGFVYNTTSTASGGNGSAGFVIITEFCSQ